MAGNQVRYGPNGPGNQAPGRSASILTRTASRGRYSIKFRSTCRTNEATRWVALFPNSASNEAFYTSAAYLVPKVNDLIACTWHLIECSCLDWVHTAHGGFDFSEGTSTKWIFDVEIKKLSLVLFECWEDRNHAGCLSGASKKGVWDRHFITPFSHFPNSLFMIFCYHHTKTSLSRLKKLGI